MIDRIEAFQSLADLFYRHGYKFFLVGGTVRDYLLGLPLEDMDAVSDATPIEIIKFLPEADTTFAHLGSLKYKDDNGIKFDITTLRKESGYVDSRHPNNVIFVRNLEEDYPRRDFTINAMYMDKDLKIYDFCERVERMAAAISLTFAEGSGLWCSDITRSNGIALDVVPAIL